MNQHKLSCCGSLWYIRSHNDQRCFTALLDVNISVIIVLVLWSDLIFPENIQYHDQLDGRTFLPQNQVVHILLATTRSMHVYARICMNVLYVQYK